MQRSSADRLLLDVQAEFLERLDTRTVVPLLPQARSLTLTRYLNPVITFNGATYVLQPQWIVSVPRIRLGRPVGSLTHHWDEITRALDMLFTGF